MLEIKNINKSYNREVLNDITFELEKGTICGLFGVNGAGKSTLLKILSGMEFPDSGEILFNNSIIKFDNKNIKIGAMIENPSFLNNLSGFNNLKLLAKLTDDVTDKMIIKALMDVGLYDKKDELYKKYSLGMKQRLYFASVIMRNIDILLLDEPFNGLDPIVLNNFEKLLKQYKNERKIILISSHDIRELQTIVDKAIFIDKGKIIYENNKANEIDIFNEFINRVSNTGNSQ